MAVKDGRIVKGDHVRGLLGETGTDNDVIITLSIRRAEGAIRRFLGYDPVQASRTEYYPQTDARGGTGRHILESDATHAVFTTPESVRGTELQLQHIPVRASTAMQLFLDYNAKAGTQSGSFAASSEKTEGTDFWPNYDGQDDDGYRICRDGILRSHGMWPTEPNTVKVVYTAGYSAEEFQGLKSVVDATPIWDAVLEETVQRAKRAIINKKSSTLGYVAGPITEEELGDYRYRVSDALAQAYFGIKSHSLLPESIVSLTENGFVNYGYSLYS